MQFELLACQMYLQVVHTLRVGKNAFYLEKMNKSNFLQFISNSSIQKFYFGVIDPFQKVIHSKMMISQHCHHFVMFIFFVEKTKQSVSTFHWHIGKCSCKNSTLTIRNTVLTIKLRECCVFHMHVEAVESFMVTHF